ncbi:MAG TPA: hypothetical protein VHU81_01710, partial [Thermoanaerobaculia bacterium]|nr:hypothetical protein [Thermoanaerobaculia bacterium]
AVDPTDSQTVFLATELNNAGSSDWAGIFRSRDGGQAWEKVGEAGTYIDVETHPDAPGVVLALGLLGLYRSADHGTTWTKVLPHGGTSDSLLWALAWAPSDPGVVYVYRGDGLLLRSLDGGTTWGSLGKRLPRTLSQRPLAVDPLDPNTLVFEGESGPVRLTLGAGRMLLDQGLINNQMLVLYFDPNDPLRLLGGTLGAGLMEYRFQPGD